MIIIFSVFLIFHVILSRVPWLKKIISKSCFIANLFLPNTIKIADSLVTTNTFYSRSPLFPRRSAKHKTPHAPDQNPLPPLRQPPTPMVPYVSNLFISSPACSLWTSWHAEIFVLTFWSHGKQCWSLSASPLRTTSPYRERGRLLPPHHRRAGRDGPQQGCPLLCLRHHPPHFLHLLLLIAEPELAPTPYSFVLTF